jgi:hypothetical protein
MRFYGKRSKEILDKNKTRGRGLDKRLGLYTLNCLLQNFFKSGEKVIFKPHNKIRERERERTEDKEDKEEDESSSGEELFFSSSFLLSFLYSFFGVFVVERLC